MESRKIILTQLSMMGIPSSASLTPQITHLICHQRSGTKFEMAQKWGIQIRDQKWLDDCYRQWKIIV